MDRLTEKIPFTQEDVQKWNLDTRIMLNEAYPCVQGEGLLTGVPSLLLRFTGCKLRCQFKGGNLCDSYKSSWVPEKAQFTYGDIKNLIDSNYPQITDIIISGGGPTSHGDKLRELVDWITDYTITTYKQVFRITLETEGSEFVPDVRINVLSLSPKLKSSIPVVGCFAPEIGREIKQSDVRQHEKWRTNYEAMDMWLSHIDICRRNRDITGEDYCSYLKFVVTEEQDFEEIEALCLRLAINAKDVYIMPEGVTNDEIQKKRIWLIEQCIKRGYRYCERVHVVAYGNKRFV